MKSWGHEAGRPGLCAWAPGSDSHGRLFYSQDRVLCGGQADSSPSSERCGRLLGLCSLFDAFKTVFVFSTAFSAICCGKNCPYKSAHLFQWWNFYGRTAQSTDDGSRAENVHANMWPEGNWSRVLQGQGKFSSFFKSIL